jgi:hypothetical protein
MNNIFPGTAGFSYKDWEGVVYPADLKKRKIHPLKFGTGDPIAYSVLLQFLWDEFSYRGQLAPDHVGVLVFH